ncbi:MAG: c-type cytochrome [Isosphaeraceae bacterium]
MTGQALSRRTILLLNLGAAVAVALLVSLPASAGETEINGVTFTLPSGFTIEPIAGPPLVDRPIVADFDEQGRLYVADSSGSNDPVQTQLARKPHRIVRLEDTDGDGRFDRRTIFADKMMFPEGAMWLDGSLYVSAPPSIWKLTDTDGDGVADRRVEWFEGKTLTGCANDLHGPYAGPDGWIYWCKGAFDKQTYERPGKKPFVTRASHIFRCRPDGSGIEPVMTGGMDNPVDVVFTPGGERIFTTTFFQHPGGGQRDGLIHAVYGGVYGKVHDVLDGHTRTSAEVLPVLTHLGPAAPCGLTSYESAAFGAPYLDNLFACNFNLQKVTRHVLTPKGATYLSRDEDFLVAKEHDFHPTDVLEDADGSLVVLNTGGWYKLCCPTSQLAKPDVLGAIYRVRRTGAAKVEDPRGLRISWTGSTPEALTGLLDDPRPAVRRRAIAELGRGGTGSVPALTATVQKGTTPLARRNAVWASTRIDDARAREVARAALGDRDETVRQVAAHSASVRVDREALPFLLTLLGGPSDQNRRVAAEAIGRIGDASAVPALLSAASAANDRVLSHALTYALIEINDPKPIAARLSGARAGTLRAALVALDQMENGGVKPEVVAPELASKDRATREAASWIASRHPEWGSALAGFLKGRLEEKELSEEDQAELSGQLARFASETPVQDLISESIQNKDAPSTSRRVALQAVARSGLKEVPARWIEGVAKVLSSGPETLRSLAVAAARALPLTGEKGRGLTKALLLIGDDAKLPAAARLDALAAVPGGLSTIAPAQFAFLVGELDPEKAPASRSAAANLLSKATLDTAQLLALTDAVKAAGPLEMDRLLTAFENASDNTVGEKLIEALKHSSAIGSLRIDMIKPRIAKFGEQVRREADTLYATLNADAAKQNVRLESLLPTLKGGDVRRGQEVFNSAKAACLSCHAVGYVGGTIGPDLTAIGRIRTERDLLEAILFPSLSFVRSYEPLTVATRAGKVVNGLLRKDSSEEVVLALSATEEAHIPRDDIEEVRPGTVSVMPAGLDQQLTSKELADLLAFLLSRK